MEEETNRLKGKEPVLWRSGQLSAVKSIASNPLESPAAQYVQCSDAA